MPRQSRRSTPQPKLDPEHIATLHQLIDQLAERNPRVVASLGILVGAIWEKQIGLQTVKGGR